MSIEVFENILKRTVVSIGYHLHSICDSIFGLFSAHMHFFQTVSWTFFEWLSAVSLGSRSVHWAFSMFKKVWGFIFPLFTFIVILGNNTSHLRRSLYLQNIPLNKIRNNQMKNTSKLKSTSFNLAHIAFIFHEKDDIYNWSYNFRTTHTIIMKFWGK